MQTVKGKYYVNKRIPTQVRTILTQTSKHLILEDPNGDQSTKSREDFEMNFKEYKITDLNKVSVVTWMDQETGEVKQYSKQSEMPDDWDKRYVKITIE